MQQKILISNDEIFNNIISKLKELEQFQNYKNDFWLEYSKLEHDILDIPKDIYDKYKEKFNEKTWYDLLELKNRYLSYQEFKKFCIKNKINSYDKYKLILNNDLPYYPDEYYRLNGWNGWKFKQNSKLFV